MKRGLPSIMCAAIAATPALASDCEQVSVGHVPLNDLGAGLYLGQFQGGLYPGGVNTVPGGHAAEGLTRASAIQPRDTNGGPAGDGVYVLLSVGMSNTTQEFCSQNGFEPCDEWTFAGQAADHPFLSSTGLVIANGARGGQAATSLDSLTDQNWNRVRDDVLAPAGLTETQVQVLWVKQANPGPSVSLPAAGADAYALQASLGDIARAASVRYPNLQMIFFTSRIYAGYASTTANPEPYAYESGFSVKWLIEAQIQQMAGGGVDPIAGNLNYDDGTAPWLAWGWYPWADGLTPRSDGLVWECSEFSGDGSHPAFGAEEKVGGNLLDFFLASPFTQPWFTDSTRGDIDGDGVVSTADFLLLLGAWGPCPDACPPSCPADLNGNCVVGTPDMLMLLANWTF
jgi:hypothetical protein